MLKSWARNKCLQAMMIMMRAKEGEWFEMDGKEWCFINGEVYSRPLMMDVVNAGVMFEDVDAKSFLRNGYKPRMDAVYYYLVVNVETKEWKIKCAIYHDTEKDKQNVRMRNCFPDVMTAEKYQNEWKKIFG